MITKTDIEKLAKLSRLKLTEVEKDKYAKDMDNILAYIGQLEPNYGRENAKWRARSR